MLWADIAQSPAPHDKDGGGEARLRAQMAELQLERQVVQEADSSR